MSIKTILAAAASLFAMLAPANAATLNVNGSGILMGAAGVDVNGTFYDVTFHNGTCDALFSACNELTDFDFDNATDAGAAVNALFNQVLIDGPAGNFDSEASKVNGCDSAVSCWVLVVRGISGSNVYASTAWNYSAGEGTDFVTGTTLSASNDSTGYLYTFAKFELASAASPVPVPASALLLLAGLGGLGAVRRKARAA